MLSDVDKLREIYNELALLPFFGGNMSDHIIVEIGPYRNERGAEITALRYRIKSDLKHQPEVPDKIFRVLTSKAEKLGISMVTTF